MSELNRCTIERPNLKVTIESGDVNYDDVLQAVEDCMKGLGFELPGHIQVELKEEA